MTIGKIFKYTVILLAVIVLVCVLVLSVMDFSRFQPEIEAVVQDATGREFSINGDFSVKVLPSPTILVEDVTLSNASWGSEPELLRVGHFSAKIGLWSLLSRPIVIHDLKLADVDVLLETNADDEANWDMGGPVEEEPEPEDSEAGIESPIDLRHAEITNVSLVYRAPESEDTTVVLESLTVDTDASGRHVFDGQGRFADTAFTLSGSGDNDDAELEATYGDVRFSSSTRYAGESFDIDISVGSLESVGKLIEVEDLPAEDLTLAGNIVVEGSLVRLSDLVVGLADARVALDGEVDGANGTVTLSVDAAGDSLGTLSPDLPAIPFSGKTELALAEGSVDLDPFEFRFGDSDLSGRLHVEDDETPALKLEARSSLIDLTPFESEDEETDEDADTAAASDSDSAYVFKDEPLPLEALEGFKAEVDLGVERLKTSTAELKDLAVTGTVSDGDLELESKFAGPHGGGFENQLTLTTSGDDADLKITAKARDLKVGLLSGPDIPKDLIPATGLDIDISGSGSTPRALASSADGRFVVTQGAGRVKNDLIETLSGDVIAQLFSALNPFAEKEEFSNWECTVFGIDFESGLGEISGFLLQSEKLMVVGGGEIDLNTEKLTIEFNTKPRSGVGVSADMFVTPFVGLSGTLASPTVGLNKKGVLLEGGAAVLTGGMSFLYKGLVDRATAEAGQCEQALEAVGGKKADADGD
jgi:AsmA protein